MTFTALDDGASGADIAYPVVSTPAGSKCGSTGNGSGNGDSGKKHL